MTTDDRHGTAGQTSVQLWAVCSQLIDLAKSDLKLGLKSTFVLIYYVQLPADVRQLCAQVCNLNRLRLALCTASNACDLLGVLGHTIILSGRIVGHADALRRLTLQHVVCRNEAKRQTNRNFGKARGLPHIPSRAKGYAVTILQACACDSLAVEEGPVFAAPVNDGPRVARLAQHQCRMAGVKEVGIDYDLGGLGVGANHPLPPRIQRDLGASFHRSFGHHFRYERPHVMQDMGNGF